MHAKHKYSCHDLVQSTVIELYFENLVGGGGGGAGSGNHTRDAIIIMLKPLFKYCLVMI